MKFLLVFALAMGCLTGITSFAVDVGDHLEGSSRKVRESGQDNKPAKIGGGHHQESEESVIKTQEGLHNDLSVDNTRRQMKATSQVPAPVSSSDSPATKPDSSDGKSQTKYDYTNILTVLSGGGLVTVLKAIQSVIVKKKSKKRKEKKKSKKDKKHSESSSSGSDSEDEPKTRVAVQIELQPQQTAGAVPVRVPAITV